MFQTSSCFPKPLFLLEVYSKMTHRPDCHLFYKIKTFEVWCFYIKLLCKLSYIVTQQRIHLEKEQQSPKGAIPRVLIWNQFEIFGHLFHELIKPQIQLILLQNTDASQRNFPRQQSQVSNSKNIKNNINFFWGEGQNKLKPEFPYSSKKTLKSKFRLNLMDWSEKQTHAKEMQYKYSKKFWLQTCLRFKQAWNRSWSSNCSDLLMVYNNPAQQCSVLIQFHMGIVTWNKLSYGLFAGSRKENPCSMAIAIK